LAMGYVTQLQFTAWPRRGAPTLRQLTDVEWSDVEAAVRELSGYEAGTIMLVPEDWPSGEHMVVIREEGEFECQLWREGGGAVLIDSNVPRAFPDDADWEHRAVPMEAVLRAVRSYHTSGTADPELCWEEAISGESRPSQPPRLLEGRELQAVLRPRKRSKRRASGRQPTR
jgi:hypothetical protein